MFMIFHLHRWHASTDLFFLCILCNVENIRVLIDFTVLFTVRSRRSLNRESRPSSVVADHLVKSTGKTTYR